jgi:hypothetical protein
MNGALRLGRPVFALTALGFAVLLLLTLDQLPPVVASHFDGAGVPNGWSSRGGYALLLLALGLLLPLGTVALVALLTRRGPGLLNLPARDYWRRPEHGAEAVRRSRAYMWWLAVVLTAGAAAMHLTILGAHRTSPPRLDAGDFLLLVGVLLAGLAAWSIGWYRLFRPGGSAG